MHLHSSIPSLLFVLMVGQVCSFGADAVPYVSARDQAAGNNSSLASPATGAPVIGPDDQDYVFMEEWLLYTMKQQKNSKLRLFTSGTWRHDSNVFLSDVDEESDTMWSSRSGFQYSYGDDDAKLQFLADYSIQFNYFDKFSDQNSINNYLSTSLVYRMKKTTMKLSGQFTDVTGGDLDVAGQAQRIDFTPNLQISYDLTSKIRIGLSGQMQRSDYNALLSSTTYRLGTFADFAFSPQLRMGLQINQMLQDVDGSGQNSGQDYLARIEWEAFKKLIVNGTYGINVLHTPGNGSQILPLGSLGLKYEVGPKTSLNASIYSRSQSSPSLTGQYFQSSGAIIGLQQQVGRKFNLGADFGYDYSDYRSYAVDLTDSRTDQIYFFRPWLKYTLHRHFALELFYQHTTNASSGTGARGFDRDLYGLSITSSW